MDEMKDLDLLESSSAIQEMMEIARKQGGYLSGEARGAENNAVESLKRLDETRISLGSPRDRLTLLTPELFKTLGVELDPITAGQLAERNFYYMTMAVSMVPGSGVQFSELKLELDFTPKGEKEALVHSMFPNSEFKAVINWGAGLQLGLDAGLNWKIGTDGSPVELQTKLGGMQASVANKNEYKGFIAIPEFSFKVGRADIEAAGAGDTFCYWKFARPELKETQTMRFGLVFKLPAKVKKITLTGKAKARVSRPWLTAALHDVWQWLNQDRINKGVFLGDEKPWELDLPTPKAG
jgi:hypothetical protein